MTIRVSRHVGCYDLLHPNEKGAKWTIYLPEDAPAQAIWMIIDPDSQYDLIGEDDPWEVARAIRDYAGTFLYSGSWQREKVAIEWMIEHEERLRIDWLQGKIESEKKRLERIQIGIDALERELLELLPKEKAS